MGNSRIELQNLTKYYYSETAVTQALRKINLQFHMGEFVAITGESGSGKSTLLKVISGMETFDDGELFVDGEPTFQFDEDDWEEYRRRKIGFVFQDYSLIGHYSAKENIVMALLVMGEDKDIAEKEAELYLTRVGLEKQMNQRASKLSSGQKQRLSIARALAKKTDIIVADEPTGNLDSETGEQIIKLLKDLSKDHLVIMVTHNYEQVESYVTRKIRLHDGELVLDVPVNEQENIDEESLQERELSEEKQGEMSEGETLKTEKSRKEERKRERYLAHVFANLNFRTQFGRVALFSIFFLVTAVISFLFLGQIHMNRDDIFTKKYSNAGYLQQNEKRLSVKRQDGKKIDQKDLEKLRKIANVVDVDQYDLVNDIQYHYIKGEDYEYDYRSYMSEDMWDSEEGSETEAEGQFYDVSFTDKERYMRCSSSLKQPDLAQGTLPKTRDEIVMNGNEKYKVGDEIVMYFTNQNLWGSDENYIQKKLKVVGLLKSTTQQIYFSPAFCEMLASTAHAGKVYFQYNYSKLTWKYENSATLTAIVGEGLADNQLRSSAKYGEELDSFGLANWDGRMTIQLYDDNWKLYNVEETYDADGNAQFDQDGNPITREKKHGRDDNASVTSDTTGHGTIFVEVSENMYNHFFRRDTKQASVYINSYAKTDHVIKALNDNGYDAISTLRVGSDKYDDEKVQNRLRTLGIAIVLLVVMMLAEILILRSLMKIRIKDQFVMKNMGMKLRLADRIGYVEMFRYCLFAVVLAAVAMNLTGLGVPVIHEMLYYYELPQYIVYVLYNLVTMILMVTAFNHLLRGRMDK